MATDLKKASVYRQLATSASLKATHLSMLNKKIESEYKLMIAMSKYYDEQADICFENANFGFNLDL